MEHVAQHRVFEMIVRCNCFKENRTRFDIVTDYIKFDGQNFTLELPANISANTDCKALFDRNFEQWKINACEHHKHEYANVKVYFGDETFHDCAHSTNSNINVKSADETSRHIPSSDFEETLEEEGGIKEFPLMYKLLPIFDLSNSTGKIDNRYVQDLLFELKKLENRLVRLHITLIDLDTNIILRHNPTKNNDYFAYHGEYKGYLHNAMLNSKGFNITKQRNSTDDFINKEVVFNSTHFKQQKAYNNQFFYIDCESGAEYLTKLDVANFENSENDLFEKELIVIRKQVLPHRNIIEPLKIILRAANDSNNSIFWSVIDRNSEEE